MQRSFANIVVAIGLLLTCSCDDERANVAALIHDARMETHLRDAWRAKHPGQSLPPRCAYADPVSAGYEMIDGPVLVIANDRLGIALTSRDGKQLLAYVDTGCSTDAPKHSWYNTVWIDQSWPGFLVHRVDYSSRAGDRTIATAFRRRGSLLEAVIPVIEHESDQRGWNGHDGVERYLEVVRASQRADELIVRYSQRVSRTASDDDVTKGTCTLHEDAGGRFVPLDGAACSPILPQLQ